VSDLLHGDAASNGVCVLQNVERVGARQSPPPPLAVLSIIEDDGQDKEDAVQKDHSPTAKARHLLTFLSLLLHQVWKHAAGCLQLPQLIGICKS